MDNSLKDSLKEKILEKVRSNQHVTFAELTINIPDFKGECDFGIQEDGYEIVFWSGMSREAIEAIKELRKEEKIHPHVCSTMVYIIDGMTLKLPVQTNLRKHKKPHWVPITYCTFPESKNKKKAS